MGEPLSTNDQAALAEIEADPVVRDLRRRVANAEALATLRYKMLCCAGGSPLPGHSVGDIVDWWGEAAARAEFPDDLGDHLGHTADDVHHVWYRIVPTRTETFDLRFLMQTMSGRGAFAVTEINLCDD